VHIEVEVVIHAVDGSGNSEPFDQVNHELYRLNRPNVGVRGEHTQSRHVVSKQLRLTLGQLRPVDTGRVGTLEKWVIHVGDVLRVRHPESAIEPRALQQVEGEIGRRVTEVSGVVRGDAADIQTRTVFGVARHQALARRVVDVDGRAVAKSEITESRDLR